MSSMVAFDHNLLYTKATPPRRRRATFWFDWRVAWSLFIIFAFLASDRSFADPAVVTIDAQQVLAQNFSIPAGRVKRVEECLPLADCRGMCARKVPCEYFQVVRNVQVEQLNSAAFGTPVVSDIDGSLDEQKISINNCLPRAYHYEREDDYQTGEYVNYSNSTVYTNVQSTKNSFDVNASLFKFLGGKYGEGVSESVTYTITDKSDFHKDLGRTIKVPIKIDVPVGKWDIIKMSDKKKSITIPITISATLKAEVHEEIRALNGDVQRDTKIRTLADTDVDKRTVQVQGSLYYKASDQEVEVTPDEKSSVCPATDSATIERPLSK
jgi:hypothetical protein